MYTKKAHTFLAHFTFCAALALSTLVTQGAFATPIPQTEMDQLHNFFCGTQTAANGILIALKTPPPVMTPEAQKMAQLLTNCQIQKQNPSQYTAITIFGGSACPIGYTKVATSRPQADGSVLVSTTERGVLNSEAAKILTGLSQYSVAGAMTTVTNNSSGAFTASGNAQKRYTSATGDNVVTVQQSSSVVGTNLVASTDNETYAIAFGAKNYSVGKNIVNGSSTCMISGASASCTDFNYIMCATN